MGRTKSTVGINPTRFNKGKRARFDSPNPPRNIEPTKDKKQRYEELKTWSFISKRKVILLPEEFDSFLNGLLQRNWTKLADPYPKYDPNIVLEFYTNAWVEDPNDLKAKVKGKWIYYDRNAINQFLGNPLPDNVECTYRTIKNSRDGFRERTIIEKLCIPNKSFYTGSTGHSLRIKRKDMKTLAQVWMTFLLANIIPLVCQLLYFIMRDDYKVDVAQIISKHIYKTARLKINKNNEKAKGSLGFPTLITTLCASQEVAMNPTIKIRPAIDKKFIDQNCINLEEAHQQPHPPHPANVEDQPFVVPSGQQSATPITMEHNASNHKGILYIQQGLYHGSSQGQNNPWMTPAEFNDYLSWPRDRHNFSGEAGASGVGTRVGDES
ncbi:hypothetical protein PHAVU_003G122800 [Phaseolus vulgaris]|uniref:Putative plant transposon protein domain-containing protein n=1 Tax=Phaseolus vulgaris TaxID=3885 RepID=V7CAU8_PHAVU|nr:hypothetical protein PHAVU_003G122800g [Phaseolus vulgaris]ESW26478.1 hypothetical protein PHAVU_003G122800g [Phaseolus vulgaris]